MKIAFIGQKGITTIAGGVERRVSEVSSRMAKKGHDVFVYTRTKSDPKKINGVNMVYLPTIAVKSLEAIVHTFLASVHAIFQSYDVVHYQAPGPSSLCWIIRIFRPDITLVATFNSQDAKHKKWGVFAQTYLKFGERIISTVPNKTIVVSEILRDMVKEEYGKNAVVVRNGAHVIKSEKTDFIEKHNLEKNKYFFTASRLVRHKGIHYLISAFRDAKSEGKIPQDMKMVVVGGGAYTDDYVAQVQEMAHGRDDIVLLGHESDREIIAQLFTHAFAYVQPSEAEGLSNALLEALGHGLPVIASDIPENIAPIGENGLVFQNSNVNDLKEKLIFAVENEEEVTNMGKIAKKQTEKNYSWQKNAEMTLELYREIAQTKS
ncbi:MAG: hypothetical protein CR972_00230 [Candidatus Moraniibacteriota bacterium]|nr:MAG: hypothetical protein CR972_00230 [Candidatus Moranbacteria bacterium]